MKTILRFTLISFLALSWPESLLLAGDTTKKMRLKVGVEEYTLTIFQSADLNRHFFGEYAKAIEFTGGIRLYLFPDYKFIYTDWCDVCEEKMIANGNFSFNGGEIRLNYNFVDEKFKNKCEFRPYYALWGQIERKDYVEGFVSILVDEKGLEKIEKRKDYFDYMIRQRNFEDWQGIYKHLIKVNK